MTSYCIKEMKPPFLMHSHVPYYDLHSTLQVNPNKIHNFKSWYHINHNLNFFTKSRNSYLLQGLHNIYYSGVDFTANFHEHALLSGLIIAHKLGAGYPFKNDNIAKMSFITFRNWMLYGLNPLLPLTTKRGQSHPKW
jgi:predicted NAD/FAD-binding protein